MKSIAFWFVGIMNKLRGRWNDLEFFWTDDLTYLTNGLKWFMTGSRMEGEPPMKHAIRITDVIVSRASALLTHISIMLAVCIMIFQYYYSKGNKLDIAGWVLCVEILSYLILTLFCLQVIRTFGQNQFDKKQEIPSEQLLVELNYIADIDRTSPQATVVKYYNSWEDHAKKIVSIDEGFIKYTFEVLDRKRVYDRALFFTIAVTIFLICTITIKIIMCRSGCEPTNPLWPKTTLASRKLVVLAPVYKKSAKLLSLPTTLGNNRIGTAC